MPYATESGGTSDSLADLTDGELEYLATGKLPRAIDPHAQDDAA
jgi:hypothetical protein